MNVNTFNEIRRLVYQKSGIYLAENKMSLVTARLQKRLRMLGLEDYGDYLKYIADDDGSGEIVEFLNVISTNTTYFFREPAHFTYYREIIGQLLSERKKRIRVWCAASSTGEEPYTLAMCYKEECGNIEGVDFKMLATDISTKVLQVARDGVYKKEKLSEIPGDLRYKYFERKADSKEEVQASADLRALISFKRLNLSETPFPMNGPLDIVFCRNVMIYFDQAVKSRLLEEIYRLLKPGGYLFIGHSETISGINNNFKMIKPALYAKK